jgi:hypothetical protein
VRAAFAMPSGSEDCVASRLCSSPVSATQLDHAFQLAPHTFFKLDADRIELLDAAYGRKERVGNIKLSQFRIVRNNVFHTDKATAAARRRVFSLAGPTRLEEFDKRAATLSTPEQIEALEAELSA